MRVSKQKRMRRLRFDPDCPFEVARALDKATEKVGVRKAVILMAWVAESHGWDAIAQQLRAIK